MAGDSELNVNAVDMPEMPKLSALPKREEAEKPMREYAPRPFTPPDRSSLASS